MQQTVFLVHFIYLHFFLFISNNFLYWHFLIIYPIPPLFASDAGNCQLYIVIFGEFYSNNKFKKQKLFT